MKLLVLLVGAQVLVNAFAVWALQTLPNAATFLAEVPVLHSLLGWPVPVFLSLVSDGACLFQVASLLACSR